MCCPPPGAVKFSARRLVPVPQLPTVRTVEQRFPGCHPATRPEVGSCALHPLRVNLPLSIGVECVAPPQYCSAPAAMCDPASNSESTRGIGRLPRIADAGGAIPVVPPSRRCTRTLARVPITSMNCGAMRAAPMMAPPGRSTWAPLHACSPLPGHFAHVCNKRGVYGSSKRNGRNRYRCCVRPR